MMLMMLLMMVVVVVVPVGSMQFLASVLPPLLPRSNRLLLPSSDETVRRLSASGWHMDELELDQQREVIGRYVRMGATDHLVLPQPVGRDGPEQPERYHALLRVEYVIDNTFKFECIICIWHYIFTVC
uniref:Putative secreted peptide n=1 Tax=Anopheles braziliensis TaxID=58242 RepID=A0A2M3ZRD8_9DIPT